MQNDLITDNFSGNQIFHFEAIDYIKSNSTIDGLADIIYDAGNEIELLSNFEVVKGAEFHGFIDGCPD